MTRKIQYDKYDTETINRSSINELQEHFEELTDVLEELSDYVDRIAQTIQFKSELEAEQLQEDTDHEEFNYD